MQSLPRESGIRIRYSQENYYWYNHRLSSIESLWYNSIIDNRGGRKSGPREYCTSIHRDNVLDLRVLRFIY